MGVVLGLVHEHQRTDRDEHILYRPENVQGYAEALKAAAGDGVSEEEAKEKLRDDHAFCMKYGFRGEAYVSKYTDRPSRATCMIADLCTQRALASQA